MHVAGDRGRHDVRRVAIPDVEDVVALVIVRADQRKSPRDKNGISALSLRRQLGVNANTAWLIKHDQRKSPRDKLMQAMIERDDTKPLAGIVQMDDAYWGGERHGGSTGRGSPGKTPFVAAVQITAEGFPMAMRMDVVPGFRKTALAQWAQRHLAPGTAVVSDGLNCFPGVTAADCTHVPLVTGGGPASVAHRARPALRCWRPGSGRHGRVPADPQTRHSAVPVPPR